VSRLRRRGERGTGVIEFTWLFLLLLVPVVYLLLAAMEVQQASYGATAASRAAGRAYVLAPDEATARLRAETAARVALADQGVDWGTSSLNVTCSPNPGECLSPGSLITVHVTVQQAVPLTGPFLGESAPSVRVSSSHAEPYGTYREDR
jgi:Flp pilus assembly protein TadG